MNLWQVARQVRYQIKNRDWTGTSTPIFPVGSVVVSNLPITRLISQGVRVPFSALRIMSGQVDPEYGQSTDILRRDLAVTVAVGVHGDHKGEDPLIGAHRTADTSKGRGLLEVEEEVLDEIGLMNALEGVSIQFLANTIPEPQVADNDPSIMFCDYVHQAWVTRQRAYHECSGFTATDDAVSGDVDLAWDVPPDRFDRLSVILRRASGSTPPATYDAGTGVTLSGLLAESVTDSPGVGTFSYSLFAAYDEIIEVGGSGRSAGKYSAARTQTVAVT